MNTSDNPTAIRQEVLRNSESTIAQEVNIHDPHQCDCSSCAEMLKMLNQQLTEERKLVTMALAKI